MRELIVLHRPRRRDERACTAALLVTAIAIPWLVVACDSDSYFGGSGGFFPTPVPTTTNTTPIPPGPCDEARAGQSCTSSGPCEEKIHANTSCNARLRCSGYTWRSGEPAREACASDCPAAYAADGQDASCAIPGAGSLICEYPEGTCGCAPVQPLRPDGGADAGEAGAPEGGAGGSDGGQDGAAGPVIAYEWRCVKAVAGCPRARPAEGETCVRPLTCNYGDCLFEDGVQMRCYSGRWAVESSTSSCDQ